MERASIQQQLAAAARNEEAVWTPECLEPDALIALIEQGADTPAAVSQMAHVVSCAYCRQEFDEMEQTLQMAARARELQAPAPAQAIVSSGVVESRSERRPDVIPFWRRLFSPSLGFAIGAVAAVLLLYLAMVRPLEKQTHRLQSQIAQQERDAEARIAETRENAASLQIEKERLQQSVKQNQIRIAALERSVEQGTQRIDDSALALETLREAASVSDQALAVLNETQRGPGSEPSPIRLFSPIASVLLSQSVSFQWEATDDATEYVVIVMDSASKEVAKSAPLKETQWTTLLPAAKGKEALNYYEWLVMARKGKQEVGRSSAKRFAVLDAKKLVEQVKAKRSMPANAGSH